MSASSGKQAISSIKLPVLGDVDSLNSPIHREVLTAILDIFPHFNPHS